MTKVSERGRERGLEKELKTPKEKVQELQRKLYLKAKSEPKFRFYALYDRVYQFYVLLRAWEKVKENKGAPGIDKQTIEEVEKEGLVNFIKGIQRELREGKYKPEPVRRVYIPKADGNKRPLGIPTIKDRVVQMAAKLIVEPIFEADFEDVSYGYRPKRSGQDAVKEIWKYMNWGYDKVVDGDIKDCFGTIPHRELLDMIATRVVDGKMLKLIKMFLKAGVMEKELLDVDDKGTPQGGVISPLLANIYLDKIDKGWKPYSNFWRIVRYADDFVILAKYGVKEAYGRVKEIITKLKLKVNTDKTRIVDTTRESFDFLGYTIRKANSRKNGKLVTYAYPSRKLENRIREKIKHVTNKRKPVKAEVIVAELNRVLRGWVNYFRMGNSRKSFDEIRWYAENRIRKFMRYRRNKSGYGYGEYPSKFIYGKLGLYNDYQLCFERRKL